MTYRAHPDPIVPASEFRCEAMTKPRVGWPDWGRESHRCIRRASQSRAGHSVCSLHGTMPDIRYWSGEADPFPKKIDKRRWAVPAGYEKGGAQ